MRLCIDPGHGLHSSSPRHFDPGAVASSGEREADIVLAFARTLRTVCVANGIEVFMTRVTNDQPAPLVGRVQRATEAGADVLLSLHCNAAVDPRAHGTETLYRESREFAIEMQRATLAALGLRDRGVKRRPELAMLRFPKPCALIELGFISNAEDRAVLLDARSAPRFAAAIVVALAKEDWT